MARKRKEGWLHWALTEGAREGLLQLLSTYWPGILPVLTAIGQYFYTVPWPYFFTALAIAVGASAWAINQISARRSDQNIEKRVVLSLGHISQLPMSGEHGPCGYQLTFNLGSIYREFLYFETQSVEWAIGLKTKKSVDFEDDKSVLPPGIAQIISPTLEGLEPDTHNGNFTIIIHIGREPQKLEYEMRLTGSFQILAKTPTAIFVPQIQMSWRATKRTIESID
jgi:hypothetical protein